jgi:hypothetical protein
MNTAALVFGIALIIAPFIHKYRNPEEEISMSDKINILFYLSGIILIIGAFY